MGPYGPITEHICPEVVVGEWNWTQGFQKIEFKSNHMGLLFYENEKHSPGNFAKISILKKFI